MSPIPPPSSYPTSDSAIPSYRPALQRSVASTGSLPLSDSTNGANGKRKMSTAKLAALNAANVTAASAQSTPLASPTVPRGALTLLSPQRPYFDLSGPPPTPSSIDMIRIDSNDSQRSLKNKSSRKELKELARSTTPLSNFTTGKSSRKASMSELKNSDENDDDNSTADDSFTCCYGNEFDRQHKASKAKAARMPGNEDNLVAHQRWLDATFRKLSQKSGVRQSGYSSQQQHHQMGGIGGRSASFSSIQMQRVPSIDEGHESEPNSPTSMKPLKAHFLDFTSIISPIPRANEASSTSEGLKVPNSTGSQSTNVTPRPADFQRFPHPPTPSPVFHDALELQPLSPVSTLMPPPPPPQSLRSRRSEDSLTLRKRMQRQPSTGANVTTSPQYSELNLNTGHPVPRLPEWARTENRMLSSSVGSNGRVHGGLPSMEMARAVSHQIPSTHQRPFEMNRAASQDTGSLQLYLGPSLMSNFDRWEQDENVQEHLALQSHPPRSQSSMEHRQPPRPYLHSLVQPSHRRNFVNGSSSSSAASASTTGSSYYHLNRESISSATSDSDIGSSVSSVPQTPVSKYSALPQTGPFIHRDSQVNSIYYDVDPVLDSQQQQHHNNQQQVIMNGIDDSLATVRSASNAFMKDSQNHFLPPSAHFMTPRMPTSASSSSIMRRVGSVPHVASVFGGGNGSEVSTSSNISHSTSASMSKMAGAKGLNGESKAVIHGKMIHGRPRANTTSSTVTPSSSGETIDSSLTVSTEKNVSDHLRHKSSKSDIVSVVGGGPISPERVSSLSHARKTSVCSADGVNRRESVASNISCSTSTSSISGASNISSGRSSNSSGSGASALLSYMRSHASKSQSNLATKTTIKSSNTSPKSSPTKRNAMTAEEFANSIGRRFGKGMGMASSATTATASASNRA